MHPAILGALVAATAVCLTVCLLAACLAATLGCLCAATAILRCPSLEALGNLWPKLNGWDSTAGVSADFAGLNLLFLLQHTKTFRPVCQHLKQKS